ncbi:MAG TPA: PilZ domain-containing protein [Verrucomicrobiae bacterium]|nr:PilZ domain-containing protein [Verrucomicrobiae bacterium]
MFQLFAKDDPKRPNPSPRWVERRKHPRYEYVREIEICRDGTVYAATTFEISESGMSAATPNLFRVGAIVQISPILSKSVKAIIRRKLGTMYGFEFLGLSDDQKQQLRQLCEQLPLFQSMADI